MEISYWKSRWKNNKIGWHMEEVYPLLPEYWPLLKASMGARVLVPLCGKSLDMRWLTDRGYQVIGVEVAEEAIQEFIGDYPERFSERTQYDFKIFESGNISLWLGDFLKLPAEGPGPFDIIYDKAALVAFPAEKRKIYADKINELSHQNTRMLLQAFEYKQDEMTGPPFAVFRDEIHKLYGGRFSIKELHRTSRFNDLIKFQRRGLQSYLDEVLYLLEAKSGS